MNVCVASLYESASCSYMHFRVYIGRASSNYSQYDVLPVFDDCGGDCETSSSHPAYGKKQLSCFVSMFNMFDSSEEVKQKHTQPHTHEDTDNNDTRKPRRSETDK